MYKGKIDTCLFCKEKRFDKYNEEVWASIFRLQTHGLVFHFTICPKCKEHKINDIFEVLSKNG